MNWCQADEDRDTTADEKFIDCPFSHITPEHNSIWGHNSMCEAEIIITVNEDKYTTEAGAAP